MHREGSDFQLAAEGALVERLDILQDVLEAQSFGVNAVVREAIEHEGVVGIGAVAKPDRINGAHGRVLRAECGRGPDCGL